MLAAHDRRFGRQSVERQLWAESSTQAKPKLLDRLAQGLRSRHYSQRTEQTYSHSVGRCIFFDHIRCPAEISDPEFNAFLSHLAVKEEVRASTQNQPLSALLFSCRHVIGGKAGDLGKVNKNILLPHFS